MRLPPGPRTPYSYRSDPGVPAFPDDKPLIVFDGHCVICSGWARFVVRHDRQERFRLATAQSALGQALYTHYGLDGRDYETNILLAEGGACFESEATIRMFEGLGRPWSAMRMARLLPRALRDRAYHWLAHNRLRLFGARRECYVPDPSVRARFLS